MGSVLEWFIGTAIALTGLIGGMIVRDRQVHKSINEGDEKIKQELYKVADHLHARVTKVQEEYVRRDDMLQHIARIENSVDSMVRQQNETNRRIDTLLTVLTKQHNQH